MTTRRRFLRAISGAVTAYGLPGMLAAQAAGTDSAARTRRTIEPRSARIRSIVRRDDTIVRHGGQCDIFPMTWTTDDRQFGSFSDGVGWSSAPKKAYNTRAIWVDNDATNASFKEVATYPDLYYPEDRKITPLYYGFSALATKERIYHFLSTLDMTPSNPGWNGVKLIYSSDRGLNWFNQNGSTPVVWEPYSDRSRGCMLFFEEEQRAFSFVSLLQMGRGYEANRDGYAYGYGTNGNPDGVRNQLVMFRVPTSDILDRNAYEFFGGIESKGAAVWVKNAEDRSVVHTFPPGWVDKGGGVQTWVPSVVYNPALGLYLMASSGVGCFSDGDWVKHSKPSYLGFWTASDPWGPWTQVYEDLTWTPGNDAAARCYSPQISPKWIAPDGKSFWLVWSDFQKKCDEGERKRIDEAAREISDEGERARFELQNNRRCAPYYAFNTQRFDIVVA